jgi:gluconolactonase
LPTLITSNQFPDPLNGEKNIQISKVTFAGGSVTCEKIQTEHVPMANGGVNYQSGILFCAQGTKSSPGGLAFMSSSPPYKPSMLLTDFYGRHFNSVNDVVVHSDTSIWFTDPNYGSEQGIRPRPVLPNQVYRYDAKSKAVRAMADGFGRPNGICFGPDEKILYITDTDWIHGDGTTDLTRASTM